MDTAFAIIHNYRMLEGKPKPRYYKCPNRAARAVRRYRDNGILAFYYKTTWRFT